MILLIDLCWKDSSLSYDEFVRPIHAIAKAAGPCVVRHYTEIDPKDVAAAERIILCGTALADNAFQAQAAAFEWLKQCRVPVLGICAGMQVIALLFGGRLMPSKEIGMARITVLAQNPLFAGHTLDAYALHGSALLPVLHEFDVLARSERCVQAIKHKTLPFYGILFHPEVRNEQIVMNFLAIPRP